MPLAADEQLILELMNRARLDPVAEAARLGTTLNEGLAPGTISAAAKQVLAPNAELSLAADRHSHWMLDADTFSHTGAAGSDPGDRMAAADYRFTGSWAWGENIAWGGTTGQLDFQAEAVARYESLFFSEHHRENTLSDSFREIGLGHVEGRFTAYEASMLTEAFARSGSDVFLTGVAIRDRDGDAFYDIGEGLGSIAVAAGGSRATSAGTGGYALQVAPGDRVAVTVSEDGRTVARLAVALDDGSAKLDLVRDGGGDRLLLSADAWLKGGVRDASLLGIEDLALRGSRAGNALDGNRGDNLLAGKGGADRLAGDAGNDVLLGGGGRDRLAGGTGRDRLDGQGGNDVLTGGAGRDTFVFDGGRDRITDFADDVDTVRIALGGRDLTLAEVIDRAQVVHGDLVIGFGGGDRLTIADLGHAAALGDDLGLA